MFKIDANDIPIVRTRQALLALDLQNDIVSDRSPLHVDTPPGFLQNIVNLVPHFRAADPVIWIRSTFVSSRLVNRFQGESEKVITDGEVLDKRRQYTHTGGHRRGRSRPSSEVSRRSLEVADRRSEERDDLDVDDDEVLDPANETFLTVEPGNAPQVVIQGSAGSNLTDVVLGSVDNNKDLFFEKSHYSAFKDGKLVQILRSHFVTKIYICGALSNISVFATAMDAARHGYAITIISDCLGYRSKARHDEAMHQLTQFTGCNMIDSQGLIRHFQQMAQAKQTPTWSRNSRPLPRPRPKDSSLENLMSSLNITTNNSASIGHSREASNLGESARNFESLEGEQEALVKEPPKRERVSTKVKVRRRAPETSSGEIESSSRSTNKRGPIAPQKSSIHAPSGRAYVEETAVNSEHKPFLIEPNPCMNFNTSTMEGSLGPTKTQASKETEDARAGNSLHLLCEGDTSIIENLLSDSENIFERIRDEVRWQKMSHQGGDVPRLVCVQGDVAEDGSLPIYRHPADESPPLLPFSPLVSMVRDEVEKKLGHTLNHVLIQFYRDGTDHITEHSDKTLDIVPHTFIVNVSLGAQRTMVFRTKKAENSVGPSDGTFVPRKGVRAPLPHNSMCKMGLLTNMRWLHGIRQDKRMTSEKTEAELAYNGGRMSLTFRLIGTFLDKHQQKIWGQGATSKTRDTAKTVINGYTPEAEAMLRAFGKENHSSEFNWAEFYGKGFDVLHISNSPKLFLSGDIVEDQRVKLALAEYGIEWTEGQVSSSFNWKDGSYSEDAPAVPSRLPVKFVDNDLSKSTVLGDFAILCYLDTVYGPRQNLASRPQVETAKMYTRGQQAITLLQKWRANPFCVKPFQQELEYWDAILTETPFAAGDTISIADYAVFPIFEGIAQDRGPTSEKSWPNLIKYYYRLRERDAFKDVLGNPAHLETPSQTPLLLKQ